MRRKRTALLVLSALVALSVASVLAQSPGQPGADAIEEDWQLVIANPDPLSVGPQITTVMGATGDPSAPFVAFDMNYREYPTFAPGGMQLQVWSGGKVNDTSSQGYALFNTSDEVVTWTQRMSLSGGAVFYNINNGQSSTWGKFGQGQQLNVSYPSPVGDLGGYSPDQSAAASGASWQSNNVTSLTLVAVRYYANGRLIAIDPTPRTLIAAPDHSN